MSILFGPKSVYCIRLLKALQRPLRKPRKGALEERDLTKLRIDREPQQYYLERRRQSKLVRWSSVAVAILFAASALYWSGLLVPRVDVHVARASFVFPSRALTMLNASGYVVAQRKAAVSSKATGRLQKLYVQEGSRARKGEVLAQLENRDLHALLEEAEAGLRVAEATLKNAEAELKDATLNYERLKSLRETGSISQQAFDTAEARYKKAVALDRSARAGIERARASLNVAEVNLEYSLIRAPFDGVVLTKDAEEGEVVAPFGASLNAKAAVVTMADMDSLMVEVDVAESSISKVRTGAPVEIALDAFPQDRFPGVVQMIVPTADRSKATVLTKVKFDQIDERILPQMSAKVAFLSRALAAAENQPFLGIPDSAIVSRGDRKFVFRVDRDRAHETSIKTGRTWGDTAEILDGLEEGDVVVVKPATGLKDGSKVRTQE